MSLPELARCQACGRRAVETLRHELDRDEGAEAHCTACGWQTEGWAALHARVRSQGLAAVQRECRERGHWVYPRERRCFRCGERSLEEATG